MAEPARAAGSVLRRMAMSGLSAAGLIASTVQAQIPVTTASQAAEVRAAFEAIDRAVAARDTAVLGELVHPRFAMLHALGQIDTREAWFALVEAGRLPRQTAERRELQPEIVVAGDTALVRALVQMTDPAQRRTSWMRSTAVFVREDGRWRQINLQSSYLYEGPVVAAMDLQAFAGTYAIPGRDRFLITPRDGYLELRWSNGAVLPLVPLGPDRFSAGVTSSVSFVRDSSRQIASVQRRGNDGDLWWIARKS